MILRYYIRTLCLLAGLGFCACESEDAGNDFTAAEYNVAGVQLAMSVDDGNEAATRMTEDVVQSKNDASLRDIEYLRLVPFAENMATPPINAASQRLMRDNIFLVLDKTYRSKKHRLYTASLVPSGTGSFLAYAHPAGGGESASATDKFTYGSLIPSGLEDDAADDNASSITFSLDVIGDDDSYANYDKIKGYADKLVEYLTALANASYTNSHNKTVYWRDQRDRAGQLYEELTHNGYVFSIHSTAALKSLLEVIRDNNGITDDDLKAAVSKKAKSAIDNRSKWEGFTGVKNMPFGMMAFKWDDNQHKFIVLTRENSKTYLNPPIANYKQLTYPAQLWYTANSKIHTSEDNSLTVSDLKSVFNKEYGTWETEVVTDPIFTNTNNKVNSKTTVVAIHDMLKYGVGRLQMRINAKSGNMPPITNLTLLEWRGVLVTNQHRVGYDFQTLNKDNTGTSENPAGVDNPDAGYYIVYDRNMVKNNNNYLTPPSASNNKWTSYNHTLVLPSKDNEKVYVIVELFNKTTNITITGHKGCVIPPQSYFYMVGELAPSADKIPTNSPASGRKVFESTLFTDVSATIRTWEGAYNYVPDLTSPALVLGLNMKLNWEQLDPKSVWLN